MDAAGNVSVTGGFRDVLSLGGGHLESAGSEDVFVVKHDRCGAVMWAKRFGDQQFQEARSIDLDQHGNILVAGWLQGSVDFGGGPLISNGLTDGFVAKLDPDGNHLWSTSFGDRDEQFAHDVAVDDSDNVIVTGSFWSTVNFGVGPLVSAGFEDLFVAKLSPSGETLWNERFGDEETQEGLSLATDPDGNIVVTGYMLGTLDFAQHSLVSAGTSVMLLKLAPDGAHLWGRRFGEQGFQYGQRVAVDAQGNIALSGGFSEAIDFGGGLLSSEGGIDLFLATFNPEGNARWHKGFGDAGDQIDIACAADGAGNVVVTGSFSGEIHAGGGDLESHGSEDLFVAKFDSSGEHLWSSRYGDSSFQGGWGVTTDSLGNILVAGVFTGGFDLGNSSISGAGNKGFIASFMP
ncbi:hypothetical protein [Chondromyces apiculatus]|uniref:hypothetical protein n=1 Tax=Chondromyces apiculatus TaxID=51 RepID=UPI0012DCBD8D|nr:hypothetical protein [Chondromyces apiculatus]